MVVPLSEDDAREIALAHLHATQAFDCALLPVVQQTKGFWSFRWNSREAIETQGRSGYRNGLGPVVVERSTRKVTLLPAAVGAPWGIDLPVTWPADAQPSTLEGAHRRAQLHLDAHEPTDCVVMTEHTIERWYGWAVFYNSRAFLDTGAFEHTLVGNGPILVLRNGEIHRLTSALSAEAALQDAEARLGLRR